MSQRDLERHVARATGESVDLIRRLGFGPAGSVTPAGPRRGRRGRRRRRRRSRSRL